MLTSGAGIKEVSELTGLSEEKIEALKFGKTNAPSESKETDAIEILEIAAQDSKQKHFVTKHFS